MKRTIDIMTAARAKGVELPKGWWRVIGARSASPSEFYIGPDLERAENIYHAFTVADALGGTPIDIEHFIGDGDSPSGFYFHAKWFLPVGKTDRYAGASAPERHLALIAACEAALGIECGEAGL